MPRPSVGGPAALLALQRAAGNRAVGQLVGRAAPASRAPVVQRYTVVPWGNFATAGARFAQQTKNGNGFMMNGSPNISLAATPALRVSQNGELAVQDANLGNAQPKVMFATDARVKSSNAALMRSGSKFIMIADGTKTVTVTVAGNAVTLQQVMPVDLAAGLGGYGTGAGEHPAGTTGPLDIAQKCDAAVTEVTGGPSSPALADPTVATPHKMMTGLYAAEAIAPPTAAGQPTMAGMNYSAAPATNVPKMQGVADRYARLMAAGGGAADVRRLGVNKKARPKVGEGYFTESQDAGEAMVAGQNPNDPARLVDIADPYNNRTLQMPQNQRSQQLWGFHYAGVVAEDAKDRVTLENYAREAEGTGAIKDSQYYFQMYGSGAQSFHEAWATIGHGGKEFVNPITMVVKRGGKDKTALDGSAARHFGQNADDPLVKDAHVALAAATTADEQTVPMLKGLAYANAHVSGKDRGRRSRLRRWKNALAYAPVFPETNPLRDRLRVRLGKVKKSFNIFG